MKHEMGINAKIKEVSTKRVRNNRSMIRKKAVESLKLKAETLRGWGYHSGITGGQALAIQAFAQQYQCQCNIAKYCTITIQYNTMQYV